MFSAEIKARLLFANQLLASSVCFWVRFNKHTGAPGRDTDPPLPCRVQFQATKMVKVKKHSLGLHNRIYSPVSDITAFILSMIAGDLGRSGYRCNSEDVLWQLLFLPLWVSPASQLSVVQSYMSKYTKMEDEGLRMEYVVTTG